MPTALYVKYYPVYTRTGWTRIAHYLAKMPTRCLYSSLSPSCPG